MRERAAVFGGSIDAGPTPAGGFRVEARLPIVERRTAGAGADPPRPRRRSGDGPLRAPPLLEAEPDIEVVGEAADGAAAVEEVRWRRPDIVLMDVQMPGIDGLEATRRIVATGPLPRVVILTTFDLDEYLFEALRAGASGFLLKHAPADDLIAAVRTVAAGNALLAPARDRPRHLDLRASRHAGARARPAARAALRARARGPRPRRARPIECRDRRATSWSARRR